MDRGALEQSLRGQGEEFFRQVTDHCPHLFASVPFFVSACQVEKMRAVIAAVTRVVALRGWQQAKRLLPCATPAVQIAGEEDKTLCSDTDKTNENTIHANGVFLGYDFHLNAEGVHLIEINTNAGGAFLNHLLLQSQRAVAMPGIAAAPDNLEQVFLEMFHKEWRLGHGEAPLRTVAIVDEEPQQQYLYPEFLLAQRMFERAGITALIADPNELEVRDNGLYCRGHKIDLVYNRLTDFSLQRHAALSRVFNNHGSTVITPHPLAYALYADKHNLTLLSNYESLQALGATAADMAVLQACIPQTRRVQAGEAEQWWQQRKQWFFKPAGGFGSKGAYRGANLTKRVFTEIMQADYVAQRLAPPGERAVDTQGTDPALLKSDIRCYVYDGQLQFISARLYQGQTTNFRTTHGGFAQVRIVG
jgi:hypothetical protein